MQLTIVAFLKEQLAKVPAAPHEDLSGKTVIVVGANTGIGFEAAKHFASMKPGKLILACRDQKRGDDALQKIKGEIGFNSMEVSLIDLKSFSSVSAFAERFEKSEQRLDILVANAGVSPSSLEVTSDGWEAAFQINNLSTNLLCLLLLPVMSRTAQRFNVSPRVVVVTSELHYWAKLAPNVLDAPNPIHIFGKGENITKEDIKNRYFDTKLLNVLFVRGLNQRLRDQSIIVNSVNPGFCVSSLRRELSGIQRFVADWLAVKLLARTAEEGSRQLVWAALGSPEDTESLRGAYISSMKVCESSDFAISEESRAVHDKIWDTMLRELASVNPKLTEIVSTHLKN
ncbi:short-chain dehydrogenase [Panaeolus papilionaceus]|nr:short-chain dehydrogenase [Panaeolus papilionaceus]